MAKFVRCGFVGSIPMDLSKDCGCIPHDLLLVKLQAYGFNKERIRLLLGYLTNLTQRTKIDPKFSDWTNILNSILCWFYTGSLSF